MRSASTVTGSREHERPARTIATLACLIGFVCATALYFFAPTPDRLARAVSRLPTGQQERTYLQQRPFDAIGFVAYSDAAPSATFPNASVSAGLMSAALALSPTDPGVLRRAVRHEQSVGSPERGLEFAATLALYSPTDRHAAFELLRNAIGTPAWQFFFRRKLNESWSLTDAFLHHVCAHDTTAKLHASQQLLWDVASKQPVSPQSLRCVEQRLVEIGQTDTAYRLHLGVARNLSRRVDYVYNGGFEMPPSGGPFDWTINTGGEYRDGFVASIRSGIDLAISGNILHVRFSGQPIRGPVAIQTLALELGLYQLSYRTRESGFTSDKVPRWTVRCAADQRVLTTGAIEISEASQDWTTRTTVFAIPPQCVGQTLRLETQTRLSALEGIRGTLAMDDVVISRVSVAP